jgi:hypothetical protein
MRAIQLGLFSVSLGKKSRRDVKPVKSCENANDR